MIRGTTPTHIYTLPFGVENVAKVRILYAQKGKVVIAKTESDCTMEGNIIKVRLTQDETLALSSDAYANVQIRVLTARGDALASQVMRASVGALLEEEVLA